MEPAHTFIFVDEAAFNQEEDALQRKECDWTGSMMVVCFYSNRVVGPSIGERERLISFPDDLRLTSGGEKKPLPLWGSFSCVPALCCSHGLVSGCTSQDDIAVPRHHLLVCHESRVLTHSCGKLPGLEETL